MIKHLDYSRVQADYFGNVLFKIFGDTVIDDYFTIHLQKKNLIINRIEISFLIYIENLIGLSDKNAFTPNSVMGFDIKSDKIKTYRNVIK